MASPAVSAGVAALDGDAGMFDGNLYPSPHCTSGNPENRTRREASCSLSLSLLLAAGFACFLTVVGAEYAVTNYVRWSSSGGISGTFDSIPIPYWTVTASIPFAFGLSTVRLLAQAALVAQGHALRRR